jgi:hypothetical protein
MTTPQMEIILAKHFNPRTNLIVPNISWGLLNHECDLLVLTPSGHAYEIEIKISKGDLISDKKKRHKHKSHMISKLFFAIPKKLEPYTEYVPANAGILIVDDKYSTVKIKREAKSNNKYKFTDVERYKLARLGTLRIWGLKEKIEKFKKGVK